MNMASRLITVVFLTIMGSCVAWADAISGRSVPYGSWNDSRIVSYEKWDAVRSGMAEAPRVEGNRPVIPGVAGRNLELLQDAVARKKFRAIAKRYPGTQKGDLVAARRYLSLKANLSTLRGDMAEAMFLDKHAKYGYIGKSNAAQHDVYRPNPTGGRGQHFGQVKFHMDGNPATYARDMVKDFLSKDFFVPDDHVEALKAYLRADAERLQAAGKVKEASAKYRNANRAKPIGSTSGQIDTATREAIAEAKLIRVGPYISIGVASILMLAPTAVAWYEGEMSSDNALYYVGKGGASLGAGIIADQSLRLYKGGLFRGTLRGNALVAVVVLAADTSWSIYEYGGMTEAVQNPEFLMHFGGGLGATGLGFIGMYAGGAAGISFGGYAGGAVAGPVGATVGGFIGGVVGGVVVGGGSGMVGYFGGYNASRWVLKNLAPEYLFQQEALMTQDVIERFRSDITRFQTI